MKALRTFLLMMVGMAALAFGRTETKSSGTAAAAVSSTVSSIVVNEQKVNPEKINERWMVEGEKRYRANCGRCHQAPHKFPPRAMAMAIRHMRVRAMLTENDMKYVTYYMTH
jgi:cytochrome c5